MSCLSLQCDKYGYQGGKKLNLRFFHRLAVMNATNGLRSEDTQREERWQEGAQRLHLHKSPSATDGSSGGNQGAQLRIHIENTSSPKSLVLYDANTKEEVIRGIFRAVPELDTPKLFLELFAEPYTSKPRQPLNETSNLVSEIWVTVYLRKH
jgi:hypothetical protein